MSSAHILHDQANFLYGRTSRRTIVFATLFAWWMLWVLRGAAPATAVLSAALLFSIFQAGRWVHIWHLSARGLGTPTPLYLAGNALTGLCWGVGTAFVYGGDDPGLAALAAIGVGGMCGTAVAMYGGQKSALWSFTTPMMVPMIAAQLASVHPHAPLFGATMLIGWLSTLGTGGQVSRSIRAVLDGRRRFAALASEMEAKHLEVEQLNRQLQRSSREQALLLERAEVGIAMLAGDKLMRVNTFMCQTLATQRDQLEGRSIRALTDSQDRPEVDRLLAAQSRGVEAKADLRLRKAGAEAWYEVAVAAVAGEDIGVWVFNDVTARLALHHQVKQQAEEDSLTGLLNRRGYEQAMTSRVGRYANMSVVVIDLDGFKPINDNFGHAVGDLVLAEVGRRIQAVVRAGDIAARTGGDEFVVVLIDAGVRSIVEGFCERLLATLCTNIHLDGVDVALGASIGAACGSSCVPFESLHTAADQAMYRSKRGGARSTEIVEVCAPVSDERSGRDA